MLTILWWVLDISTADLFDSMNMVFWFWGVYGDCSPQGKICSHLGLIPLISKIPNINAIQLYPGKISQTQNGKVFRITGRHLYNHQTYCLFLNIARNSEKKKRIFLSSSKRDSTVHVKFACLHKCLLDKHVLQLFSDFCLEWSHLGGYIAGSSFLNFLCSDSLCS